MIAQWFCEQYFVAPKMAAISTNNFWRPNIITRADLFMELINSNYRHITSDFSNKFAN